MTDPSTPPSAALVVLGDQATTAQHPQLVTVAATSGRRIAHHSTFPVGALSRPADLSTNAAVIDAGVTAATLGCATWLPYPSDVGGEDNLRRLHLGLRRVGVPLLVGPNLTEVSDETALSPLDKALRTEIAHVENLSTAIAARAGAEPLIVAITGHLAEVASQPGHVSSSEVGWDEQVRELETYARNLADNGLTQAAIAGHLNGLGHRTRRGRRWTQVQVSNLLKGRMRPKGTSRELAA